MAQKQNYGREKLQALFDVPLTFRLDDEGTQVPSRVNGIEYRYNVLYDNRPATIWLPAEGRNALLGARAQVGDVVELVKGGHKKNVLFTVQRLTGETVPPPPPRQMAQRGETAFRAHEKYQEYKSNEGQRTVGVPEPAPEPEPALEPVPEIAPMVEQWFRALQVSYHAWERLNLSLRAEGKAPLPYTTEDVRALAVSMRISHDRKNGAR